MCTPVHISSLLSLKIKVQGHDSGTFLPTGICLACCWPAPPLITRTTERNKHPLGLMASLGRNKPIFTLLVIKEENVPSLCTSTALHQTSTPEAIPGHSHGRRGSRPKHEGRAEPKDSLRRNVQWFQHLRSKSTSSIRFRRTGETTGAHAHKGQAPTSGGRRSATWT